MIEIGAYEAKTKLAELLNKVQTGERVIITRHHVPIAMLIPVPESATRPIGEIIQELTLFRKSKLLKGDSLQEMIDEGRP